MDFCASIEKIKYDYFRNDGYLEGFNVALLALHYLVRNKEDKE